MADSKAAKAEQEERLQRLLARIAEEKIPVTDQVRAEAGAEAKSTLV